MILVGLCVDGATLRKSLQDQSDSSNLGNLQNNYLEPAEKRMIRITPVDCFNCGYQPTTDRLAVRRL